jgi:predicted dehydrogenase
LTLQRGCHVYCEKPLAHDLYETQLLARAAQQSSAITQMANQHRSSWGYQRARELLKSGVLGKVLAIHAWTLRPLWPQGIERPNEELPIPEHLNWDLWLGPAPQRPFHTAYHPIAWRGWTDFGTGAIGDLGTHLFDPILGGLELDLPSTVHAQSSGFNGETFPEWSILRFDFLRRDGAELLELTWYDGGKQPPREVTGADRLPDDGALVIGERGRLFIPTLGKPPRLMPAALEQEAPPPAPRSASIGHITQWLTAIKGQQPELCDTPFLAGAQLTDVCLLGNLALASDKPVDVKAALASAAPRQYRDGWSPVRSD